MPPLRLGVWSYDEVRVGREMNLEVFAEGPTRGVRDCVVKVELPEMLRRVSGDTVRVGMPRDGQDWKLVVVPLHFGREEIRARLWEIATSPTDTDFCDVALPIEVRADTGFAGDSHYLAFELSRAGRHFRYTGLGLEEVVDTGSARRRGVRDDSRAPRVLFSEPAVCTSCVGLPREVRVLVVIDRDGRVKGTRFGGAQGAGEAEVKAAVRHALERWRFEPAVQSAAERGPFEVRVRVVRQE